MKALLVLALLAGAAHADPPYYPRGTATNQAIGGLNQNFLDQTTKQKNRLTTVITPGSCPTGYALAGAFYNNGYTFGGVCQSVGGGVAQIVAGTGITVSPAGGTGVVTVNATGGGTTGISSSCAAGFYLSTATFVNGVAKGGGCVAVVDYGISTGTLAVLITGLEASTTTLSASTAALAVRLNSVAVSTTNLASIKASSGTNADQFNWLGTGNGVTFSTGVTATSSVTVQGSAFSVGASSFVVNGGSATVAYSLTAGSFIGPMATSNINLSTVTTAFNAVAAATTTLSASTASIAANYLPLAGGSMVGNLGVNNAIPNTWVDVASGSAVSLASRDPIGIDANFVAPTHVIGAAAGDQPTISVFSNDTQSANHGGSLGFGGQYEGVSQAAYFAQLRGVKYNSTSGDYSGALDVFTSMNGQGALIDEARFDPFGNFLLNYGGSPPVAGSTLSVNGSAQFGVGVLVSTFSAGNLTVYSSVTASAFFGNGSQLTNLSTAAYVLPATVAQTNQVNTFASSQVVTASAFSVGGSSFSVSGGSATVAYSLTALSAIVSAVTVSGNANVTGSVITQTVAASNGLGADNSVAVTAGQNSTSNSGYGSLNFTSGNGTATSSPSGNINLVTGNTGGSTGVTGSVNITIGTPGVAGNTGGFVVNGGSTTLNHNYFSVGTSSFVVSGGSATVAYGLTVQSIAAPLNITGNGFTATSISTTIISAVNAAQAPLVVSTLASTTYVWYAPIVAARTQTIAEAFPTTFAGETVTVVIASKSLVSPAAWTTAPAQNTAALTYNVALSTGGQSTIIPWRWRALFDENTQVGGAGFISTMTAGVDLALMNSAGTLTTYLVVNDTGYVNIGNGVALTNGRARLQVEDASSTPPTSGADPSSFRSQLLLNNGRSDTREVMNGFLPSAGGNAAFYMQHSDLSNASLNYPISINPNGGGVSIGTTTNSAALTVYGLIASSQTIPTVACSAGSPTMSADSTNMFGSFTAGAAATNCTVTFSNSGWPNNARCTISEDTSLVAVRVSAQSKTAFTVAGTTISGDVIQYICLGN